MAATTPPPPPPPKDASALPSRFLQVCTIIGCSLIVLPTCQKWIWGNLTVYVSSYLYAQGGHSAGDLNTAWLISIYSSAWTFGVFVYVPLFKLTGKTCTLLVGIFLNGGGIILAYLSVKLNSTVALNLTLGFISGIGDGIFTTVVILVVSDWAGKRQGLVNALVFSTTNMAAMPFNLLATWYVNPLNLTPKLVIGSSSLFTQISVLENTPKVFIYLFIFTSLFQISGVFLIRHELFDMRSNKCLALLNIIVKRYCCSCKPTASEPTEMTEILASLGKGHSADSDAEITRSKPRSSETINEHFSKSSEDNVDDSWKRSEHTTKVNSKILDVEKDEENKGIEEEEENVSLTPYQLIKTPSFYAICFAYVFAQYVNSWILNYYKIFGLLSIQDDHFLTDLGTAMAIVAAFSRFLWGCCMDWMGMKSCMLLCTSAMSIVMSFFFITPFGGRWVYALVTLILAWAINGYSIIASVGTLRCYGKTHFGTNYGLVRLPSTVADLSAPLIFQAFLGHFGWFPLLASVAAFNGVAVWVIAVFVANPKQSRHSS